MSNLYLVGQTEQTCKDLSQALYRLARPQHLWEPNEVATYVLPWMWKPDSSECALIFVDGFQYPKHADINDMLTAPGDPYGSQALMQTLFLPIAADGMNSLQALLAYILSNSVIDTAQVLPHVNPALVRTKAQMEAAGWFPVQVVL
jgi:hypothetical protein